MRFRCLKFGAQMSCKAKAYAQPANPLFVPEARFIAGNVFTALGQFNAIGFAPFGVEAGVEGNQLAQAYHLLEGALPIICDAQSRGELTGFALEPGQAHEAKLGDYRVRIQGQREAVSTMLLDMGISISSEEPERVPQNVGDHASELTDARPMGLVLRLGSDEFLVIGKDLSVNFHRADAPDQPAELSRVEEGRYVDGAWVSGRILNGDERLRIVPADRFGLARITLINPGN